MKIKIGDKIYDSNKEPIMLILDEEDVSNISNMEEQRKYCGYPEDMIMEDIIKFMNE
jgi:hypothetical protein